MHETCNHWSSNRAAMLFHTVLLVVAVGFKCTDAQLEICFLPLHSGDCGYPLTRYYFNVAAGRCGQFIYWYCGGNENNFATREECEAVCMPDLELTEGPATMATTATEGGVVDDAVDLNKVTSSGPLSTVIPTPTPVVMATESPTPHPSVLTTPRPVPDICLLPRVNFLCQFMQIEPRYYYNSELDECKEFSYFGCPSNENNFHTLEECLNTCVLANIPTPVNSQSPPIYIATTTTLVVSMATTSHRMSVSMATRKTMTSSIIHSSPTTSRQLLMSTTQQVPMATGSIRTSDWWTPPTSTTTEPTVNMETDPPTSELSPPPGTTEMDQSTSPPGTTDYETGTDHGQPTPNGLTPFHHASIGVGVVVVVLLLILVAIVCVIVYRHRQREKEHRQISYHVKQTVCNYPSLDTKPNIHRYGNSTISEIFV